MHEIITLQLGQKANYLATHFWNLQESYFMYNEAEESLIDPDVHFRAGIGADGTETFLPRTVIYDLKGAFGTLRKNNALYELSEDFNSGQGLWDGKEVLHQQKPIPQSDYQKSLDLGLPAPRLTPQTVRYWSDYSRVFYHPRSVVQLNDYELNSGTMPFEDWTAGEELFDSLDKEIDLLDRDLRPFAEECDQLRALQLFTGSDDAWGGFASRYMDRLRDELGKTSIWVWPIERGAKVQRQDQIKRDMNKARCVYTISPQSSLYTPIIDAPHRIPDSLHVDFQSEWCTSALACSAVETVTLPSRLRQHYDFEASLVGVDDTRKIFELQSSILGNEETHLEEPSGPAKQLYTQALATGSQEKVKTNFDVDFTYDGVVKGSGQTFNQMQVIRGIGRMDDGPGETEEDLGLLRRMRLRNSEPMLQSFRSPLPFPILDSYPRNMFNARHQGSGIPIVAALTSSSRTANKVQALQTAAGRLIAVDEREALTNGLGEIREAYETGWMSDSDEDED